MSKVKGWDARDPQVQAHRADVVELDETNEPGGLLHFRWECVCRRSGRWTTEMAEAERSAKAHERRFQPKQQGPKALRELLTFG